MSTRNSNNERIPDYFKYLEIRGYPPNNQFLRTNYKLIVLKIRNSDAERLAPNLHFPNLYHLEIIESRITSKFSVLMNEMKLLQTLKLIKNPIDDFSFLKVASCKNLENLIISSTRTLNLHRKDFSECSKLRILRIVGSVIESIDEYIFDYLMLTKLSFRDTKYPYFDVTKIGKFKEFHGNNFVSCCVLWKLFGKNFKCLPNKASFQTCSELISTNVAVFVCWFYGILGSLLNLISMGLILSRNQKSKHYLLMLSFADLQIMIFYLVLSIVNVYYGEDYLQNDHDWKNSLLCEMMGIVLSFSILLSVSSSLLITIERHQAIVSSMKKKSIFTTHSKYCSCLIFSGLLLSSFMPFFVEKVGSFKIFNSL